MCVTSVTPPRFCPPVMSGCDMKVVIGLAGMEATNDKCDLTKLVLGIQMLVTTVHNHPVSGQLYGLEKFWAFLKYSKIKNQPIEPKLQEHLRQFKNLEDFRVVVSVL